LTAAWTLDSTMAVEVGPLGPACELPMDSIEADRGCVGNDRGVSWGFGWVVCNGCGGLVRTLNSMTGPCHPGTGAPETKRKGIR
jgi:hypothetical protein